MEAETEQTIYNHKHRHNSEWVNTCPTCSQLEQEMRNKQNAILCAATEVGLPKRWARDLFIDCELIAKMNPDEFALLLRENGSQLALPDKDSCTSALYWVDNDDMQAFYIWDKDTKTLGRASKYLFKQWCTSHGGYK